MQPSTTYLPNPFAPVGYGVNDASPESYIDRPFTYLYDVVLTANEQLTGQAVAIDTDSDFLWRAVLIATADGLFTVRFADASNYYLSSSQISSAALSTFGGQPFPVVTSTSARESVRRRN